MPVADLAEPTARRYEVLAPYLSEFQRRLWLGAEARELGPSGVALMAEATGVAPGTVRRGRDEAEGGVGLAEGALVGLVVAASGPRRMTRAWSRTSTR